MVLLREGIARRSVGAIEPCLPSAAKRPPAGPGWIHEIKHDGFRLLARRDGGTVRLLSRKGNDLGWRFPFVAMAVAALPVRSCLIDGEAIVCDETGLAIFDLIRGQRTVANAVHCAFDLIELDGEDLRRQGLEVRKALLADLLHGAHSTIVLNEHYEGDGAIVYQHACKLGCEGHRLQAARLAVSVRPLAALGEGQESGGAGREARGRGRLGALGTGQCFVEYSTCLRVSAVSLTTEPSGATWKPATRGARSWRSSTRNGHAGRTTSTYASAMTAPRKSWSVIGR